MKNKTKIAVVEGKWFENKNISVRSLFDLVSDINFDSPHEYHYEMFNNGAALKEIMVRLASTDNIHHIYIAAHGNDGALFGSNENEEISLAKVRNAIKDINDCHGKLNSIYFGSCSFGNSSNLESLLLNGDIQLRWIAGYTKNVDFVKSSVLDALFWHTYIEDDSSTPLQKIQRVCKSIRRDASGLIDELGFKVLAFDGRSSTPIMELTQKENSEE